MNRRILAALLAVLVSWLAGCAQVSHVAIGELTVRGRLAVTVDRPWNQFERGLGDSTTTWTQDGITVDALRFYVALKDGELIAPTPSEPKGEKPLAFKAGMVAEQVVALFEGLHSRGGSSFTLERIAPETFAGQPGFRFEFSSIRKADDVRLRGVGWGTVRNAELYVITYTAPRLAFFQRHLGGAQAIVRSARLLP